MQRYQLVPNEQVDIETLLVQHKKRIYKEKKYIKEYINKSTA